MNNTKLRIAELDFNSIRTNLKSFLSDQSEFTDYDFDGSGMSVLLDILAYNTHYNSYYLNMIANEMFLDSAIDRESVVAIAKHLGYVTKSATAASATVTLIVKATEPDSSNLPDKIEIPKHTKFTSTIDGTQYVFYTLESFTAKDGTDDSSTGNHIRTFDDITGVKLYEGQLGSISYTVSGSGFEQKYIVPAKNVDTTTLVVTVNESATDSTEVIYTLYNGLSDITGTSNIYFLQEIEGEQYEIYFGDGVLGRKLVEGNVININYLKTSGDVVNGAGSADSASSRTFTLSTPLSYTNPHTAPTTEAVVISVATGGVASPESIDSIKFNAPKSFQTQSRAVTKNDYESIVLSKFPNAASTIVWGGEDNDPIDPGSVYISIRPVTGLILNDVQKNDLKTLLDNYKVLSITPKVVDPDYTFVKVESTVTYNRGISLDPKETIRDKVVETIKNYSKVNLSEFYKPFRYSKLVTLIDETDDSIISNTTTISLKKRIKIPKNQLGTVITGTELNFNNKLTSNYTPENLIGLIKSDVFIDRRVIPAGTIIDGINSTSSLIKDYRVYIVDDSGGGMNQVLESNNGLFNPTIDIGAAIGRVIGTSLYGTVEYQNGKIIIPELHVDSLVGDTEYLYFYADVVESDVAPAFNQILTVVDTDINVVVKTDLE